MIQDTDIEYFRRNYSTIHEYSPSAHNPYNEFTMVSLYGDLRRFDLGIINIIERTKISELNRLHIRQCLVLCIIRDRTSNGGGYHVLQALEHAAMINHAKYLKAPPFAAGLESRREEMDSSGESKHEYVERSFYEL